MSAKRRFRLELAPHVRGRCLRGRIAVADSCAHGSPNVAATCTSTFGTRCFASARHGGAVRRYARCALRSWCSPCRNRHPRRAFPHCSRVDPKHARAVEAADDLATPANQIRCVAIGPGLGRRCGAGAVEGALAQASRCVAASACTSGCTRSGLHLAAPSSRHIRDRLLLSTRPRVQADLFLAHACCGDSTRILLLKGSVTIVAAPVRTPRINGSGPAWPSAAMGDLLTA